MSTSTGPSGITSVLLVRHGRTVVNAQARLSGRHDPVLDDVGEAQVRELALAVKAATADRMITVVTSPLGRCRQTAGAIASECLGSPDAVTSDDRFIEVDYGEWDGVALSDVPTQAWRDWRNDAGFTPPGGESLRSVTERVVDGMAEWIRHSNGGALVVASHVSPIKAAVTWALNVDELVTWRMRLSNASITRLDVAVDDGGELHPTLMSFNETMHLESPT